jgi:hypothetical protein
MSAYHRVHCGMQISATDSPASCIYEKKGGLQDLAHSFRGIPLRKIGIDIQARPWGGCLLKQPEKPSTALIRSFQIHLASEKGRSDHKHRRVSPPIDRVERVWMDRS